MTDLDTLRNHALTRAGDSSVPADEAALWLEIAGALDRLEAAEAKLTQRRCGCAWCCAGVPTDRRGLTHQRTCR